MASGRQSIAPTVFGRGALLRLVSVVLMIAVLSGGARADATSGRASATGPALPPIVIVWADSRRAQYTGAGDLYVVQANGTHPRALKRWGDYGRDNRPYGAFNAAWSPDRSRIGMSLAVFLSDPGSQVAVIDASGRRLRSLTRGWNQAFEGWTQDGRGLIHRVWAYGTSSEGSRFKTLPVQGGRSEPLRIAAASNPRLKDFDWSWTARRIAAALPDPRDHPTARLAPPGIVTMDLAGRDLVRVTRGADVWPAWSPDGRTLLFTRIRRLRGDDSTAGLYSVAANGSGLRKFVSGSDVRALDWSPDGTKVLFLRSGNGGNALWVMNADGSGKARLPFNRPGWEVLSADW